MRRRWHPAVVLLPVLLALAGVAPAASATHINAVAVTQSGANGLSITIQVDVTFNAGASGNGVFNWTTGDGGNGAVPDGTTSGGAYAGDASGTLSFGGSRPAGIVDTSTFTWVRTSPAPNVARTRLTYNHAAAGTYNVNWNVCCPARSGTLAVVVQGGAVSAPYYPMGIIEIVPVPGGVDYVYTGFNPPVADWSCAESGWTGAGADVTCYPPNPPAPYLTNICQYVNVLVENQGVGSVTGTSKCASGQPATATATTPGVGYAAASQNPATAAFPWTCSAGVTQVTPGPWRVRCAISH